MLIFPSCGGDGDEVGVEMGGGGGGMISLVN